MDPSTLTYAKSHEWIESAGSTRKVGISAFAQEQLGDIVFCEFFDSTVGRFRMARLGDPACLSLNAQGRNPCIDEIVVPGVDLKHHQMHSIAFDSRA